MDAILNAMPTYPRLPAPSSLELPAATLADPPPALAFRCVLGVRRFCTWLTDRLCPAELALFAYATGVGNTALLGAIARYDIVDFLAKRGPATAEVIAGELGLNADVLHRSLRALANMGIFEMSREGTFANNRMSLPLRSGQLSRVREWLLYFSSGSNIASWSDFAETLKTGESAFKRLHGASVWDWFETHADERAIFAECMMGLTAADAPVIAQLYPFGEVQRLCDVGGGRGLLLSEILLRHPRLRGVLQDSPGVLESARRLIEQRKVADRIELSAGSFFEAVPPGCDAYLMKNILHDWDDETCTRLLQNVRRAAQPGARMILCEAIADRCSRDPLATRADLQMAVVCDNGRERDLGEFQALLERAGFRYRRVFKFPTINVIEGEAV
ncbi:MAG: hypothetical protein RL033_4453 [Pseudomonadota bacterium]|jgi:hypothetical protein